MREAAAGAAQSGLIVRFHERICSGWKDSSKLHLIDEFTRKCLAIRLRHKLISRNVTEVLADAMFERGIPEHIRSDNGLEFLAQDLRGWLARAGAKALYIEHGSPWENGSCKSFNSKPQDGFLNGEVPHSLKEVQALAQRRRVDYNSNRSHSSLGYIPPAPAAWRAGTTFVCVRSSSGDILTSDCADLLEH